MNIYQNINPSTHKCEMIHVLFTYTLPALFLSIMALNVHILADDGKVINWGRNTYGQLGCHEYQRSLSWKPQIMDNIENVTQLAVGSEHNIAVLDTGRIVSWGWNEHGNCGTGTEEDVRVPTAVGINIKQKAVTVGTGAGHSFALNF